MKVHKAEAGERFTKPKLASGTAAQKLSGTSTASCQTTPTSALTFTAKA